MKYGIVDYDIAHNIKKPRYIARLLSALQPGIITSMGHHEMPRLTPHQQLARHERVYFGHFRAQRDILPRHFANMMTVYLPAKFSRPLTLF